jgi:hypothetical protein
VKVTVAVTDYQGRWTQPPSRFWSWEIARPYVWWVSLGVALDIGLVLGYYLGCGHL